MIVEVVIAPSEAMDPWGDPLRHEGFGAARVATIIETGRESGHQAQAPVDVAQQHPTGLRGEAASIEPADDLATAQGVT